MKRAKKFLAMLLSMAMVLGMSVTAFATSTTNSATITVKKIYQNGKTATVKYAQIIEPNAVNPGEANNTGWKFSKDSYATAYEEAYGVDTVSGAINALIASGNGTGNNKVANDDKTKTAISKVSDLVARTDWMPATGSNPIAVNQGVASWTVNKPGIYVIKIEQEGYIYTAMAAYVGFGRLELAADGSYVYPNMNNAELETKGSPISTSKTNGTDENVVSVGDIITYTISTNVPYVENPQNLANDYQYIISDNITGASYVKLTGDDKTATIQYAGGENINANIVQNGNSFTVDLTSLIKNQNNVNAGKTVIITYQAQITEVDNITNTATAGHISGGIFDPKYGSDDDEVFTGSATITKFAEDESAKLPGAGFEVRTSNGDTAALKFTKVGDGVYKYDPKGTNTVTMIETGTSGTATVSGLNLGKYYFKEVKAPEGYTINSDIKDAEISKTAATDVKVTAQDQIKNGTTSMIDTKISELPSTGGIGTTIFTVVGCIVMIGAAGLFFASRRKTSAK